MRKGASLSLVMFANAAVGLANKTLTMFLSSFEVRQDRKLNHGDKKGWAGHKARGEALVTMEILSLSLEITICHESDV